MKLKITESQLKNIVNENTTDMGESYFNKVERMQVSVPEEFGILSSKVLKINKQISGAIDEFDKVIEYLEKMISDGDIEDKLDETAHGTLKKMIEVRKQMGYLHDDDIHDTIIVPLNNLSDPTYNDSEDEGDMEEPNPMNESVEKIKSQFKRFL